MLSRIACFVIILTFFSYEETKSAHTSISELKNTIVQEKNIEESFDSVEVIHVMVALCDNKYQGIVPVPSKIGNGQDPFNNLYWGCGYGIKTYFKNSGNWELVQTWKPDSVLMERLLFKHKQKPIYLVADAYNGKNILETTNYFLESSCGSKKEVLTYEKLKLGTYGNAKTLAYIGHNGLMDFTLVEEYKNLDNQIRNTIILACASKPYFTNYINNAKANPLLWTTNLMAPEAYTLHDALEAYINGGSNEQICLKAAEAYNRYQKCGLNAAKKLVVTGF